jgi:hypothetical protein
LLKEETCNFKSHIHLLIVCYKCNTVSIETFCCAYCINPHIFRHLNPLSISAQTAGLSPLFWFPWLCNLSLIEKSDHAEYKWRFLISTCLKQAIIVPVVLQHLLNIFLPTKYYSKNKIWGGKSTKCYITTIWCFPVMALWHQKWLMC